MAGLIHFFRWVARRGVIFAFDVAMAAASFLGACYLRIGDDFLQASFTLKGTVIFAAVAAVVFLVFRLERKLWRYASMQDLQTIVKSVTLAVLIFFPVMFVFTRLDDFPRSVMAMNWFLLIVLLGGPRFIYRMLYERSLGMLSEPVSLQKIPVLLVGLGENAAQFLRAVQHKHYASYVVLGIIDDDPKNKGTTIHGVPVLGGRSQLKAIVQKCKNRGEAPQKIILSSPNAHGEPVRELLKTIEGLGMTLAKLPRITDLKAGEEALEIQPIAVEDLLGRAQNTPPLGRRKELIENHAVLITGAGGSIGSELSRQVAKLNPSKIILFEHSEYNLYLIDQQLQELCPNVPRYSVLGNVRDKEALEKIFKTHEIEVVFHAAALKHVPLVEENVIEGVLTNVIGTSYVADLCKSYKVGRMVLVSTDKAVDPTSLMGVTKRVAERYISELGEGKSKGSTSFAVVRFGNVLDSSGSVVPLFRKQIAAGGPVTVTHPSMVRYFMTIAEAVQLVIQAATLIDKESRNALFVLDMGEPVRILDLAKQMIKLAGFEPEKEIDITYSGIRSGEKLEEALFYTHEAKEKTLYHSIHRVADHVNYENKIEKLVATLEKSCKKRDEKNVRELLCLAVPEYQQEQLKAA